MKVKFIYVFVTALMMGSLVTLSAQNSEKKDKKQRPTQEQMIQMQTDRMVKSLMLDDAATAKFTPLYEKYLKELRESRMMNRKPGMRREAMQGAQANDVAGTQRPTLTDEEIAQKIKNQFAQSRKLLEVRERYYNEFSKVLSQKQIAKIYQMERNYADKFKKEFDRRKGHKQGERKRLPR